jgi:hypothetical protein
MMGRATNRNRRKGGKEKKRGLMSALEVLGEY